VQRDHHHSKPVGQRVLALLPPMRSNPSICPPSTHTCWLAPHWGEQPNCVSISQYGVTNTVGRDAAAALAAAGQVSVRRAGTRWIAAAHTVCSCRRCARRCVQQPSPNPELLWATFTATPSVCAQATAHAHGVARAAAQQQRARCWQQRPLPRAVRCQQRRCEQQQHSRQAVHPARATLQPAARAEQQGGAGQREQQF
jgi:hypothetical protein